MFGLFELELACLWMKEGEEMYHLSRKPTKKELSKLSREVNQQINGSKVAIRRVSKNRVIVKKKKHKPRTTFRLR